MTSLHQTASAVSSSPLPAVVTALAIETSGEESSVALVRVRREDAARPLRAGVIVAPPGVTLAARALGSGARKGRALLPAVVWALARAGLERSELDLVVCGLGPGSYTGLRVGLAAGRTLAFALGIGVVGVPSVVARAAELAALGPAGARSLVIARDAYRGEVYAARYALEPGGVREVGPPALVAPGQVLAGLAAPVWVVGDAPTRHAELRQATGVVWDPAVAAIPSAATVGRLGVAACACGLADGPASVLPLYLRASLPKPPA